MKSKTIRDYCDIGILKAAYNLEIDQTIFVKWTIVSESSNNEDFSNVNFDISKSNNSNDKDLIESCSKKIRIDKAEHEIVWWPCKIRFSNDEKRYFKGKRIYILEYEEREGFKSDKCSVVFEDKERVSHLDYNNLTLSFCRENELEDYLNEEKNKEVYKSQINNQIEIESNSEVDNEDKTITIQEIIDNGLFGLSESDESDSGNGGNSNGIMNIFNSLPHEKKINLAQGYREFADKFIAFLKEKMESDKDKNTITIDDIRDFIKSLGLENENMKNN